MAHWRDGGIGNMPGSDDRPIEEFTLLEKLACVATTRPGSTILVTPKNWAVELAQLAQDAFDEIQRLRGVDIKLRLTEAHYRDALNLLGETKDELEAAKKAQNGGAA